MTVRRYPIGLNDSQLALVMTAAKSLPQPTRHSFLLRVAARLQLMAPEKRSMVPNDALARAVDHALLDVVGGSPWLNGCASKQSWHLINLPSSIR